MLYDPGTPNRGSVTGRRVGWEGDGREVREGEDMGGGTVVILVTYDTNYKIWVKQLSFTKNNLNTKNKENGNSTNTWITNHAIEN